MDFYQLFAWFCKLNNVYGEVMNIYNRLSPHKWKFYIDNSRQSHKVLLTPKEWITDSLFTLDDMFYKFNIEGKMSDNMKRAQRKWKYFWRNNIKTDLSGIEVDDDGKMVAYINLATNDPNNENKVYVKGINIKNMTATITFPSNSQVQAFRNIGNTSTDISLHLLANKDGSELNLKYYIVRNKKTYGKR